MTIRAKLYTAIVVAIAGLALTVGVGIWGMSTLGDRFDRVQNAADSRALALALRFDVTDFNGWQTAYGYDAGKSRPLYVASFRRFDGDLERARTELRRPSETRLVEGIAVAAADFRRLDDRAWAALQRGRAQEVRALLLGPEITNFHRAAAAAQQLAALEDARAAAEERSFNQTRRDALRFLLVSSIVAALLVIVLLVTATDVAKRAEEALADAELSRREGTSAG